MKLTSTVALPINVFGADVVLIEKVVRDVETKTVVISLAVMSLRGLWGSRGRVRHSVRHVVEAGALSVGMDSRKRRSVLVKHSLNKTGANWVKTWKRATWIS